MILSAVWKTILLLQIISQLFFISVFIFYSIISLGAPSRSLAAPYFPPISSTPVLQSTSAAAGAAAGAGAGLKVIAPKKTQSDGEHNSQNIEFHLFTTNCIESNWEQEQITGTRMHESHLKYHNLIHIRD